MGSTFLGSDWDGIKCVQEEYFWADALTWSMAALALTPSKYLGKESEARGRFQRLDRWEDFVISHLTPGGASWKDNQT